MCDFDSFDSVGADLVTHDTVPSRQYHFHKQSGYLYLLVLSFRQSSLLCKLKSPFCLPCVTL